MTDLIQYLHLNIFKQSSQLPPNSQNYINYSKKSIIKAKMHRNKLEQLNQLLENKQQKPIEIEPKNQRILVHTLRAIIIVIDLTRSMNMKDFKPSRLSVVINMIKLFLKKAKQQTPLVKFCIAIVEQETCKIKSKFSYDQQQLCNLLDDLRIISDSGYFSMQNTLRTCIEAFDDISSEYHKQILLIQSSPSTKDYRDIFETFQKFKKACIDLNIISLVGWTQIYLKITEAVKGSYLTVSSVEEFKNIMTKMAYPPAMSIQKIKITPIKMCLARKQFNHQERLCFCHFKVHHTLYICTVCESAICLEPPFECPICKTAVVLPTDLFNHITF